MRVSKQLKGQSPMIPQKMQPNVIIAVKLQEFIRVNF